MASGPPPPKFSENVSQPAHEKVVVQTPPVANNATSPKIPSTFGERTVAEEVALALGIPDTIIQLLKQGAYFQDARQLFEAAEDLLDNPEKQARVARDLRETLRARNEQRGENRSLYAAQVQVGNVSAPGTAISAQNLLGRGSPENQMAMLKDRVESLARENHRLKQRMLCRKCKDVDLAHSGVTFLPCGHFITCQACAISVNNCPACGKVIMGTVRTYLS